MSVFNDDSGVKRPRHLSDRTADRLVQGRVVPEQQALSDFVAELSTLVPETAPAPSYQLGLLLEQGPPVKPNALVPQIGVRKQTHRLRRLSLASTAAFGVLLLAASVNTLPDPAQQLVSDVVGWATPLHLPAPQERHTTPVPTRPKPAPSAGSVRTGSTPTPAVRPSEDAGGGQQPAEGSDATPSPDTAESTDQPTDQPTEDPTDEPTDTPTDAPTNDGAAEPSDPFGPTGLGLGDHLPLP
jgi:hypothetical protein